MGTRVSSRGRSGLLYFVAVGLGYILVEIAFIQRFVLFLGHPVYALTVVVFLLLLSSGAGSLASRGGWRTLTGLASFAADRRGSSCLCCRAARPAEQLVGLPFAVKLCISAGLLVPLGFAMGMPFPTGLRALADATARRYLVEWAWAMNAASSVLGSVLGHDYCHPVWTECHFGLRSGCLPDGDRPGNTLRSR